MASDREPDYDAMSDEDLMERCRAHRAMTEAHGWNAEAYALGAFFELFHPDHPGRPHTIEQAKRMLAE